MVGTWGNSHNKIRRLKLDPQNRVFTILPSPNWNTGLFFHNIVTKFMSNLIDD